jgi:SAM-dependent methyltransferase
MSMTIRVPGAAGYGENAAALADQYESITFEEVHRDVLHLYPSRSARVLDVGAGSGRDAAALARRGHRVVAVEPTRELRRQGQRLHAGLAIEWVEDHLPSLQGLRRAGHSFELILLTAVWMHLDPAEQVEAMNAIADLLADEGRVFMSLRHGPVPEGRRMFEVSAEATASLAAKHGLALLHLAEREDMLGRSGVTWSFLVFRGSSRGQ